MEPASSIIGYRFLFDLLIMQGQRTTVESLPDTFDVDHTHASGSNISTASQQLYWNNVLNPPQPLPDFLISPDESNISYSGNINHHESEANEDAREETKMENGVLNRRGSINLNRALDGDDLEFVRVPSSGEGGSGLVTHNGACPMYGNSYMSQPEQAPSTSSASGRLASSLDGRRLLGKRKSVEGDSGQSSGSFQQNENGFFRGVSARNASPSSSLMLHGSDNLDREGSLNPRAGEEQDGGESSTRSFRMRLNPEPQADVLAPDWRSYMPSLNGQSSIWSPSHQSSLFVPVSQIPEARLTASNPSSQSQPLQSQPLGFPSLVLPPARNAVPAIRSGSLNSAPILPERSTTIIRRNNNSNHSNIPYETPILGPTSEGRVVGQLPMDWSLANGSNPNPIAGNSASPSQVGSVNPRAHYQNLPAQYPRTLSEFVRRTFPTANPVHGVQPSNLIPQRSSVQSNSAEVAPLPGVVRGNYQHPLLRSAFLMDRRAGIMGAPLALRSLASSREGRSRMISEVHSITHHPTVLICRFANCYNITSSSLCVFVFV